TCSATMTACSRWTARWAARRSTTRAATVRGPRRRWPSGWCTPARTCWPPAIACPADGVFTDGTQKCDIPHLLAHPGDRGVLHFGQLGPLLPTPGLRSTRSAPSVPSRLPKSGDSHERPTPSPARAATANLRPLTQSEPRAGAGEPHLAGSVADL